ncbi:STAS domain-containing protein [Olsenella sp. oral taxon 809]|uniref:STAS domain-containing protein n=1 Tax=Olsenella sp. oral taxon 809 TaxID=661086 RepID=UPI000231F089|nr:STAS domain-containing protein [Olsenella sp. oral taxon 809]EHF02049.1 hypothetical protein HMPREF1008_00979 [Olsenella sp. oral taxon 809 str. F0356]
MGISITSGRRGETSVLSVVGEVDVSNASELRDALDRAIEEGPASIEVDFSEVPYIDSTGIGVLVGAAHRSADANATLSVTNLQKNIARVLSLLGVDKELGAGTQE